MLLVLLLGLVCGFVGSIPIAGPVSRVLGAVILVALGLYFAFRRPKRASAEEEAKKDEAQGKGGRRGGPFVLGLVVTLVNPTLLVTWSAVVTVIHGAMRVHSDAIDAPFFGLGAMSGIVSWFATLLALLGRFREKMGPGTLDKVVRGIGWLLGVIGLALGAKVGLQWHLGR